MCVKGWTLLPEDFDDYRFCLSGVPGKLFSCEPQNTCRVSRLVNNYRVYVRDACLRAQDYFLNMSSA